jgi:N-acetylglucosamine-6-sulfatase
LNNAGSKLIPGYYTTVVTDLALDWLKQRDARQAMGALHWAQGTAQLLHAEEKYAHRFDDVPRAVPDSAFQLEGKPEWIKQRLYTWHRHLWPALRVA